MLRLSDVVRRLRAQRALIPLAAVIVIAGVAGPAQLATTVRSTTTQAQLPEFQRRLTQWDRTYGFGSTCTSELLPDAMVTLVNPYYGFGEAAPASLPFDPDTSAFAYPLLPRIVNVQWDLSHEWSPPHTADYVAVWQQTEYRSSAAQAAAKAQLDLLAGRSSSRLVCTYEDETGGVGTVYAVSDRALAASGPAAVARSSSSGAGVTGLLAAPYASPLRQVQVYVLLFALWLVGSLVVVAVGGRALPARVLVGLAFPVGCVAVVIQLAILSFVHVRWGSGPLLLPWCALAVGLALLHKPWRRASAIRPPVMTAGEWSTLAAIIVSGIVLLVLAPFGLPMRDGFAAYFKAASFLQAESIVPLYEHAQGLFYIQPTHPPFVPLLLDWLSMFSGTIDEHATLVLAPAFLCSLAAVFYVLVRSIAKRQVALWCTLALIVFSFDLIYIAEVDFGFSDLPLALLMLSGIGVLLLWSGPRARSMGLLAIGALLMGGAAWSKEEGIVSGGVAFVMMAILAWLSPARRSGTWWHGPLVFSGTWLLVLLPLLAIKLLFPAPSTILQAAGLGYVLDRMPVIVIGFTLRSVQHWFLPFTAVGVALWYLQKRRLLAHGIAQVGFWAPVVVIAAQVGADMLAVGLNPTEVHDEVSGAAGRLLTQLTPLAYLAAVNICATALFKARSELPADRSALVASAPPARTLGLDWTPSRHQHSRP
jgi:hypothetical protein